MPNIKMVKQIKMKIILLRHNHSKFHFRFYKFASFWERQTTRIFCVAELFRISFFPDNFVSWKKNTPVTVTTLLLRKTNIRNFSLLQVTRSLICVHSNNEQMSTGKCVLWLVLEANSFHLATKKRCFNHKLRCYHKGSRTYLSCIIRSYLSSIFM